MVVAGIRRTLSLPVSPPGVKAKKSYHARSTSLPCRSHPLLTIVEADIRALRSSASLDHIDRLHASLDDLLRLPQSQDALRRLPAAADRLLDAFLRLVDAHALFRSAAAALRDHLCSARAALRRCDGARLSAALRAHRSSEKEMARVAASVKDLTKSLTTKSHLLTGQSPVDAQLESILIPEIGGILVEAVAATAVATMEVFLGAAARAAEASATVAAVGSDRAWRLLSVRRKGSEEEKEMAAMEALEGLEECVEGLENGSERVMRRLVRTRVCLLNIVTPF